MTNEEARREALRRLSGQQSARIPELRATDKQIAALRKLLIGDRCNRQVMEALRREVEAVDKDGNPTMTRDRAHRLFLQLRAYGSRNREFIWVERM